MFEMISVVIESMEDQISLPAWLPSNDEDLRIEWINGLKDELDQDLNYLVGMIKDQEFGQGILSIYEDAAEGIMRACSAIRIRLRNSVLSDIADEQLENGSIKILSLPLDQQQAYSCYLFLAGLQSVIIHELDPECEEFL